MKKAGTDIDDNPLECARSLRATSANEETTDGDVRENGLFEARRQEVEALVKMDGLDLADAETMSNAWRSCDIDGCAVTSVVDRGVEPPSPEWSP